MIKRLVFALAIGLSLVGMTAGVAAQALPDPTFLDELLPPAGPQSLEGADEVDRAGDREVSDAEVQEWLGGFADSEGNAPQVDPEEVKSWVLASLSVERRVQHDTACQYWLKLENKLPFKIRNLALDFFAYIRNEDYEEPILFDTAIKSFSELRPTDAQYRDIFFEHADCDQIAYIRVEDAGRCSAGTLTKFSAQAGDCAQLIDVRESDLVCIYKEDGRQGEGENNPCAVVTQADVDGLLEGLTAAYQAGDMQALSVLFDENVSSDAGKGREALQSLYSDAFAAAERSMVIENSQWRRVGSGAAALSYDANLLIDDGKFWGPSKKTVAAELRLRKRDDAVLITRFIQREAK